MRFDAEDYYIQTSPSLVPGAISLGVPIAFMPPRLPAVSVAADGTLRQQDFDEAWRSASQVRRDEGIPVLLRAKHRPVLVLRVGAAVTDLVYGRSAWIAPLYGETDPPRRGPNIFPLPAWPDAGLPLAGYVDLYQAAMLPIPYLRANRFACRLSELTMSLLLGALAVWAEADPAGR